MPPPTSASFCGWQTPPGSEVRCLHPSAPRTTLCFSPASRDPTSKGLPLHCGRQCTGKRPSHTPTLVAALIRAPIPEDCRLHLVHPLFTLIQLSCRRSHFDYLTGFAPAISIRAGSPHSSVEEVDPLSCFCVHVTLTVWNGIHRVCSLHKQPEYTTDYYIFTSTAFVSGLKREEYQSDVTRRRSAIVHDRQQLSFNRNHR